MPTHDIVAGLLLLAVVAYGVFGGADFGGGVWDLCASGAMKSEQRAAIARAMGPVWEANHVWLIFVIVLLFAAFPPAFAALSIALFVPFHLALVGITLRGAAFVFRGYGPKDQAGRFGALFGAASVVTPLLLGMCLGAVVTTAGWLAPLPVLMGLLALALCAYLAAVFLTLETAGPLRESFRRRALLAGTIVVALSVLILPLVRRDAPHVLAGLLAPRAVPALALGTVAALGAGAALLLGSYPLARLCTVVQVACLLLGFGLAQHPYLIYPSMTVAGAAAPRETLRFLLLLLPPGAALLLPSLYLLFRVFKKRAAAAQPEILDKL